MSQNSTLQYMHQDHLTGTSLVTSDNGTVIESLKYYSFGLTRELTGSDVTDKKFTGQRLDETGLYFYGARYYDPLIGRFISADTIVPNPSDPQSINRYSYCLNNPLKYTDPSGHDAFSLPIDPSYMARLYEAMLQGGGVVSAILTAATGPVGLTIVGVAGIITITTIAVVNLWDIDQGVPGLSAGEVASGRVTPSMPLYSEDDTQKALDSLMQGFGEAAAGDPNQNPFKNKRDELLSKTTNKDLKEAINQLYRENAKYGDGGTADYIRLFGDSGHVQKAIQRINQLENLINGCNLNTMDHQIAVNLHQDLILALLKNGVIP
jgi:RHS repeat-associated protein